MTLYQWDENDPILKAWMGAFPDVVKPKADIPADLLDHLRYPEDLFKVQREILTQYHVTDPGTFYQATDRWRVPEDPTVTSGDVAQPPYYLSVKTPQQNETAFALTSVYVPQNRQNLVAFLAVDAEASSDDYGKIRILRLPGTTQISGPSQIANQFNADPTIQNKLLPFKQAGAQAIFGNLLTLPVGGGLLYVQPVYTLRGGGEGTYPVLQLVLASFGEKVGSGSTLDEALSVVLGSSSGGTITPPPPDNGNGNGTSDTVRSLLEQADAKYTEAQTALAAGDLQGYANAINESHDLLQRALNLTGAAPAPTPSGSSPTTPSTTPTTPTSTAPSTPPATTPPPPTPSG